MKKKVYNTPSIRLRAIGTEEPIAVSITGNTGIELGDGATPDEGDAKIYHYDDDSPSKGIWED